uniref:Uncharacterized protein n=1 Tax=Opuntia streptacantha TaxID=393608 RepID=A0A7C9CRZ9_OPUST
MTYILIRLLTTNSSSSEPIFTTWAWTCLPTSKFLSLAQALSAEGKVKRLGDTKSSSSISAKTAKASSGSLPLLSPKALIMVLYEKGLGESIPSNRWRAYSRSRFESAAHRSSSADIRGS